MMNGSLFLAALMVAVAANAQDPVFSQFYNSPVYLNPALVGDEENLALNVSYRSQWNVLHEPYATTQASLIYPFYQSIDKYPQSHIGGMGISVYSDKSGIFGHNKALGASASFAYNLQMGIRNINRISFAIQAGAINKRIDAGALQWGSQNPITGNDGGEAPVEAWMTENRTILDITPGVFWRFFNSNYQAVIQSVYSGVAVGHVNHPNASVLEGGEDALPLMYKYHGGVIFGLTHKTNISFNILTLIQNRINQTNLGAYFSYQLSESMGDRPFGNVIGRIGGWYRHNDSFILNAGIATNNLELGFSYDWNVTSLNRFQSGVGAYELSMKLSLSRYAPPKVTY